MSKQHTQTWAMTLHGKNAFDVLEQLGDKLRRAVSMADVLNTAAFAKDVTLPPEALQDYTSDLAGLLHEARDIISQWHISKEAA